MEYPGLFSGSIQIDAKTNKTHGSEHFTCTSLRDPIFEKKIHKIKSVGHGPKLIFPSTGRENLSPCFHPGLFSKIFYNILQLQQILVHEDTGAKKLMGGNGFGNAVSKPQKKFFFVLGTLQGLETSAVRSQSFNLERELPELK